MPLPSSVDRLLRDQSIDFTVLDQITPQQDVSATAASTVMQDSNGKVQILYPAGRLLDLEALIRATGRELTPIAASDIKALCERAELEILPGIPVLGFELVVDNALLELDQLVVASGSDDCHLTLNESEFKKLVGSAAAGNLTIDPAILEAGPLDDTDDLQQITNAVANFTQLRVKQRLEETLEFPPLPDTAQRIIKLRVDPNADIKDLSDIVETDPPLAAQVVSWAASPYYAAPGKIKSIHDAIVRVLGFDLVLNLSLGLALGNSLKMPKDAPKGYSPYWQQAVYAAASVEALVSAIAPKDRPSMGLAYLGGLLHNFGYLILAQVFPPYFSKICRYQEANPFSGHEEIERHLIGVTREQLGAWLMRSWNMPEEVCVALRYQGDASYDGPHSDYANLLYVATHLLRKHGIGDASAAPIPQSTYGRLHLDPAKANDVIASVIEAAQDLNLMADALAAA